MQNEKWNFAYCIMATSGWIKLHSMAPCRVWIALNRVISTPIKCFLPSVSVAEGGSPSGNWVSGKTCGLLQISPGSYVSWNTGWTSSLYSQVVSSSIFFSSTMSESLQAWSLDWLRNIQVEPSYASCESRGSDINSQLWFSPNVKFKWIYSSPSSSLLRGGGEGGRGLELIERKGHYFFQMSTLKMINSLKFLTVFGWCFITGISLY